VGPLTFLGISLGIGAVQCAIEQTVTLFAADGGSFGSSAIVYGLFAIALVWAPRNEVRFFYWILWRVGAMAVTVRTAAVLYFLYEVAFACLDAGQGQPLSTSLFHLMGAALGGCVGVAMVKLKLVDCEGWDIFSLRRRKGTAPPVEPAGSAGAAGPAARQAPTDERRREALGLIRDYLKEKDGPMALRVYEATCAEMGPWDLPEVYLKAMIARLNGDGNLALAEPLLRQYIQRFPETSAAMKLLLGTILIELRDEPARGIEILKSIAPEDLPPAARRVREILLHAARRP
jgi:hypothetical protein